MERFAHRGDKMFGVRQPRSFENSKSTRHNDDLDMDFNDVFGGPPRRYSMQEVKMRYSFGDSLGESSENNDEENSTTFETWSGVIEKPVFGEESVNRRRYVNGDFFDDIFKGDEGISSPRKSDYHGSNPGSRMLSPVRPSPPKAEPISASLPSQFSLPPELKKASDTPGHTSDHGSTNKNEDSKSDGMSSPVLSKSSFSKFLNRAMWGKHESRGDQYRQSPLSREASVGNLESLDGINVNTKDKTDKKYTVDVESFLDGSHFHFSIHTWAHGEVPSLIPLRERMNTKVEEKREQRESRSTQPESSTIEIKKDDERINQDKLYSEKTATKSKFDNSDLEIDNVVEHHAVDRGSTLSYYFPEETQQSINLDSRSSVKKAPSPVQRHPEPVIKPVGVLFSEKVVEQEGNRKERAGRVLEGKKGAKSANFSNEEKKNDARKKSSKKTVVSKSSAPDSPRGSGDIPQKTGVKGKVRDFVKIFSQETAERSKASVDNQTQSCRWSVRENYGMDGEVKFTNNSTEDVEISKTDRTPNSFTRTDENPLIDEVKQPSAPENSNPAGSKQPSSPKKSNPAGSKQPSSPKSSNPAASRYTEQMKGSPSTESFKVTDDSSDTYFRESFSVEELSYDPEKDLPSGDPDYDKVYDAKIKQWSQGRKGNIRSLLSTLQLVLWPESGWKPVPLVNIIEGSSVKRTYQRALLCLHPDKLQQKGAAPHQKYIAEKVFEILQEAWDHFNSLGAT